MMTAEMISVTIKNTNENSRAMSETATCTMIITLCKMAQTLQNMATLNVCKTMLATKNNKTRFANCTYMRDKTFHLVAEDSESNANYEGNQSYHASVHIRHNLLVTVVIALTLHSVAGAVRW